MATTIDVKNVKAADPGLGFDLQISNQGQGINNTLTVMIQITDNSRTYSSTVTVNSPVNDQTLSFVVPFGDPNYGTSSPISFTISVYVPANATTPLQTFSGVAVADPGQFNYNSNLPTSIGPGQSLGPGSMMNSIDGRYVGIMQTDGNFCVYKKYALNQSGLLNTDSTFSYGNGVNCSLVVLSLGRIYVLNNNNNSYVSASPLSMAMPGASMVIDDNGIICLQLPGQKAVQMQVRPGYLP
jgi:hypothetical protein